MFYTSPSRFSETNDGTGPLIDCGRTLIVKENRRQDTYQFPLAGVYGQFGRSCDAYQKTIPKGRVRKVPLGDMPVIEEPFHRVAIDLIGPIIPVYIHLHDCIFRYAVPRSRVIGQDRHRHDCRSSVRDLFKGRFPVRSSERQR